MYENLSDKQLIQKLKKTTNLYINQYNQMTEEILARKIYHDRLIIPCNKTLVGLKMSDIKFKKITTLEY